MAEEENNKLKRQLNARNSPRPTRAAQSPFRSFVLSSLHIIHRRRHRFNFSPTSPPRRHKLKTQWASNRSNFLSRRHRTIWGRRPPVCSFLMAVPVAGGARGHHGIRFANQPTIRPPRRALKFRRTAGSVSIALRSVIPSVVLSSTKRVLNAIPIDSVALPMLMMMMTNATTLASHTINTSSQPLLRPDRYRE